jgi:large subunit ribosomal protein L3
MIPGYLGTKKRQTQQFTDTGMRVPVTYVAVGPCYITNVSALPTGKRVEIGFGITKKSTKAIIGHLKKAGLKNKLRFLHSFRTDQAPDNLKLGSEILPSAVFAVGERISATGFSKGKGFAGVVKRHGFRGGPRTHGQSDRERAPGSIGQTTTPGRVYRGKKMGGRMGGKRVTVKNLKIIGFTDNNELIIKGLVPGATNGLVLIRKEKNYEKKDK